MAMIEKEKLVELIESGVIVIKGERKWRLPCGHCKKVATKKAILQSAQSAWPFFCWQCTQPLAMTVILFHGVYPDGNYDGPTRWRFGRREYKDSQELRFHKTPETEGSYGVAQIHADCVERVWRGGRV